MIVLEMSGVLLITIGALVFSGIILLLVFMLQIAAKKLVQQGDVKIELNGEKTLEVPAGSTLLNILSNEKIFLPSACGGGGTCAMCLCQITEGGGDILPTETGHINRKDQKDNWRLACHINFCLGGCSLELAQGPSRVALALHLARRSTPLGVTAV